MRTNTQNIVVETVEVNKAKTELVIKAHKKGRPSRRITIRNIGLPLASTDVIKHDKKGDTTITSDRINTHSKFQETRIHFGQMIYPGPYTIKMKFKEPVNLKPADLNNLFT